MLTVRRWITHPSLAIGGTLVGGMVELLALTRSRVRVAVRPAERRAAPGAPPQPKR